jgi:hypothetical protein
MATSTHDKRGGNNPRVQRMSLRKALANVMSDDDVMAVAASLKKAAILDDGMPNMEVVPLLLKHIPHIPSQHALERARARVASSKEDLFNHALAILFAHAEEDASGEAAQALVDALAKHATATKAMADAPNASVAPITINVMQHPDTVSTTATVTTEPRTDEVKK